MSGKVREAFEVFMAEGDRSAYTRESLAWVSWQASRLAALEEAANVADDARHAWVLDDGQAGEDYAAQRIAQAIRTLAQGGGK